MIVVQFAHCVSGLQRAVSRFFLPPPGNPVALDIHRDAGMTPLLLDVARVLECHQQDRSAGVSEIMRDGNPELGGLADTLHNIWVLRWLK